MWSGAPREWGVRAGGCPGAVAGADDFGQPNARADLPGAPDSLTHKPVRADDSRIGVRARVVEVQAGRAEANPPAPEPKVQQSLAKRPVLAAVAHVEIEPVHGEDRRAPRGRVVPV